MRGLIRLIPLTVIGAGIVLAAQYVPNDVVRSTDAPTIHVTFDNQAPGAGTQAETFTNVGSSRVYRRVRFDSLNATDNAQMTPAWIEFIGRFDSNAAVGSITQNNIMIGGLTPTWNSDNTLTLWMGGTGAGVAGFFGIESNNQFPVFQGVASCGTTLSRTGRAQLCYDTTLNALRVSLGGGAWASLAANAGTVTSVGLALPPQFTISGSPVTGAGTLSGSWVGQTANTILAGPTTGGAASPTFRAHVAADFPTGVINSAAILDGTVLFADWATNSCAAGQVPTMNAGATAWTCNTPAGTGTVTSVGLTMPAQFVVSGSPVTSSGTLGAVWASQNENTVLAGPTSGAAGTPFFRSLVAADIPTAVGNTAWCQWSMLETQTLASGSAYLDTRNDHVVVDFISGSATSVYYECNLPANYDTTGFNVDLTWVASGSIVTGNVVWGAAIERTNGQSIDNAFGATQTTTTATTHATAGNPTVSTISVSYTNAASPVAYNHLRLRVQRVGNNGADTLSGIVQLVGVTLRK